MSVNKHLPHILVLPEDDANRQIANGFVHNFDGRFIQIMPIAGGWLKVVEQFTDDYTHGMRRFPKRRIVLLIDFDEQKTRLTHIKEQIPNDLKERVFILGILSEPEDLRQKLPINRTFEQIGETLAEGCPDNKNELWEHDLLKHNEDELNRIILDDCISSNFK